MQISPSSVLASETFLTVSLTFVMASLACEGSAETSPMMVENSPYAETNSL